MNKSDKIKHLKEVINFSSHDNSTFHKLHTELINNDNDLSLVSYFFYYDWNRNEEKWIKDNQYFILGILDKLNKRLKKILRDVYLKIEIKIKENFLALFRKFFNSDVMLFLIDSLCVDEVYKRRKLIKQCRNTKKFHPNSKVSIPKPHFSKETILLKYMAFVINELYSNIKSKNKTNTNNNWDKEFYINQKEKNITCDNLWKFYYNKDKYSRIIWKNKRPLKNFIDNDKNSKENWKTFFDIYSEKFFSNLLKSPIGIFSQFIEELWLVVKTYLYPTYKVGDGQNIVWRTNFTKKEFENNFNLDKEIKWDKFPNYFWNNLVMILEKKENGYFSSIYDNFNEDDPHFWYNEENFFQFLNFWRIFRNLTCHPSFFINSWGDQKDLRGKIITPLLRNKIKISKLNNSSKETTFIDFILEEFKVNNIDIDEISKIKSQQIVNPSFYMLEPFYYVLAIKFIKNFLSDYAFLNNEIYKYNNLGADIGKDFYNMIEEYKEYKNSKGKIVSERLNFMLSFPYSLLFKIALISISVSKLTLADIILNIFQEMKKILSIDSLKNENFFLEFKSIFFKITFISEQIYYKFLLWAKKIYEERLEKFSSNDEELEKNNKISNPIFKKIYEESKENFLEELKNKINNIKVIEDWSKENVEPFIKK